MHRISTQSADRSVVIAGGGLAAQRAVETLRRNGYAKPILIVAGEPLAPYDRPPHSKEYLAGAVGDDELRFRPDDWYAEQDVELLTDARATRSTSPVASSCSTRAGGWRSPSS